MKDSDSDSDLEMYDGMLLVDPNMILDVTVPQSVLEQVERWKKGTTKFLHTKAEDDSDQENLDSDEDDSEDQLGQSSGSGLAVAVSSLKNIPGNAAALRVESVHPDHTRQHDNRQNKQGTNTRVTPTFSLGVPNRDSFFPVRQPLQGLENVAGCSSARDGVQCLQTTPPMVMRRVGQTGPARNGARVHQNQWVNAKPTAPSSDLGVRIMPPPPTTTRKRGYPEPERRCPTTCLHPPGHHAQFPDPFRANRGGSVPLPLPRHGLNVGMGRGAAAAQTSGSAELVDLSVEDTLDFFMNMNSPMGLPRR